MTAPVAVFADFALLLLRPKATPPSPYGGAGRGASFYASQPRAVHPRPPPSRIAARLSRLTPISRSD